MYIFTKKGNVYESAKSFQICKMSRNVCIKLEKRSLFIDEGNWALFRFQKCSNDGFIWNVYFVLLKLLVPR